MFYNEKKVLNLFALQDSPAYSLDALKKSILQKKLPAFPKGRKSWTGEQIPQIGEHFGFIKKTSTPKVMTLFVTKGGVLKSSLTLNIARMCALHNIKTCVLGLDMQGDISSLLNKHQSIESSENMDAAIEELESTMGIADIFFGHSDLTSLIQDTDIPNLKYIPETPELIALNQALNTRNHREYWLQDHVIQPLKKEFDLILIDAPPNWNLLITNALVATDLLLSPLECRINNFRNFKMFNSFISDFKKEMQLHFQHLYLPTRYNMQRKLSQEIYEWYVTNIENCLSLKIKETNLGEEAIAMKLSFPEFAPGKSLAIEMNQIIKQVWSQLTLDAGKNKSKPYENSLNFAQGL